MNSEKLLLGFVAGVAVGATLGILFAPDKGSATRSKIAQKSNEYAGDVGETFNEFVDSLTKKYESAINQATRMAENGKQKIADVESELTDRIS